MMKLFINELENKILVPSEHWYLSSKTEKWLPSVTSILDAYPKGAAFVMWLKNVGMNASQILKEAGEIGSNIHSAIDLYVKTGNVSYQDENGKQNYKFDEEWKPICKAMEFFEKHNPEILVHEFPFANDELGYGGTIDMVCKLNGKIWLIDYKSGNQIYESHALQIAAYATAWNKLNPQYMIECAGILHLKADNRGEDKKGEKIQGAGWKLYQFETSIEHDFEYFQYVQKLWHRANPGAKPKIFECPLSFTKKLSEIEQLKIELLKCTEPNNLEEIYRGLSPEQQKDEKIIDLFKIRKGQMI